MFSPYDPFVEMCVVWPLQVPSAPFQVFVAEFLIILLSLQLTAVSSAFPHLLQVQPEAQVAAIPLPSIGINTKDLYRRQLVSLHIFGVFLKLFKIAGYLFSHYA